MDRFLPEERNEQLHDQNGLDITKLDPGTRLEVRTTNSLYKITILNPKKRKIEIEGGQFFPEAEEAFLAGSTWGGSMIKIGWVGKLMLMEIKKNQCVGPVITSTVRGLKIITPDYEYDFEWEDKDGETS